MLTVYPHLLALYPETRRQQFGEEMMAVLADVRADIQDQRALVRAVFCEREMAGLLTGAIAEHMRAFSESDPGFRSVRGGSPCVTDSVFRNRARS
jgi:hypothetical protein